MNIQLNEILLYIHNNKLLNDAVNNVVDQKYRDDFKSHLLIQIINTKLEKLVTIYENRQLDWFILRIITNQYNSNTSSFWKEYRNHGFRQPFILIDDDKPTNTRNQYNGSNMYSRYNRELPDYQEELQETKQDYSLLELKYIILKHLEIQYTVYLVNQYHQVLFTMKHFDNKSIKEISEETKVHSRAIRRSIKKTEAYLQVKLKDKLC